MRPGGRVAGSIPLPAGLQSGARGDPPCERREPGPWEPADPVIDFGLSDENRLVRRSVREFVEAEILPDIREWDEKGEAHPQVFEKMAELGYLGAAIPEEWAAPRGSPAAL